MHTCVQLGLQLNRLHSATQTNCGDTADCEHSRGEVNDPEMTNVNCGDTASLSCDHNCGGGMN